MFINSKMIFQKAKQNNQKTKNGCESSLLGFKRPGRFYPSLLRVDDRFNFSLSVYQFSILCARFYFYITRYYLVRIGRANGSGIRTLQEIKQTHTQGKNKFCSVGVHFIDRVDYSAENMPVFVKAPWLSSAAQPSATYWSTRKPPGWGERGRGGGAGDG